jgi:hypothetical protein
LATTECCRFVIRSDDDFDKDFGDGPRGSFVDSTIKSDDAAECRHGITCECLAIGLFIVIADGGAGGICMFDDGAGERVEIVYQLPGSIGIDIVVERHLLAGKQLGVSHSAFPSGVIKRCFLVRILAVTQI